MRLLRLIVIITISQLIDITLAHSQFNQINGHIYDSHTNNPISRAIIEVENIGIVTESNDIGVFKIDSISQNKVHLIVHHPAYKTKKLYVDIKTQSHFDLYLVPNHLTLKAVNIHSTRKLQPAQVEQILSVNPIEQTPGTTLSELTSRVAGVYELRSGSNNSKPMIQGLWGNRLSILYNQVPLAGQQWGYDHAPEVDAMSADQVTVVKGAASLLYGSSNMGGAILITNTPNPEDPHLHGQASIAYRSNGRGLQVNTSAGLGRSKVSYKLNASAMIHGDLHSPRYFLTNTSRRQYSINSIVNKNWTTQSKSEVLLSYFHSETGVLRGAHISNLTDLRAALIRDTPFFTSSKFSYQIAPPRQVVNHYLAKINHTIERDTKKKIELITGIQLNARSEYDVRRTNPNIPTMNINQWHIFTEGRWSQKLSKTERLTLSIQNTFVDNQNSSETGITPFLPSYYQYQTALIGLYNWHKGKFDSEIGSRLEGRYISSNYYENNKRYDYQESYITGQLSIGMKYKVNRWLNTKIQSAISMRPPEVQELLSKGLHQGLASYEIGNRTLGNEIGFKTLFGVNSQWIKRLDINVTAYTHPILNYIYLTSTDSLLQTIRGVYPIFETRQHNVLLNGLDLDISYQPYQLLTIAGQYSRIRAYNYTLNRNLEWMPQDRLTLDIEYQMPLKAKIKSRIHLKLEHYAKISGLSASQDIAPLPEGYSLVGITSNTILPWLNESMIIQVSINNLMNTEYRSYLNRQRYFAPDMGRNISFGVQYKF